MMQTIPHFISNGDGWKLALKQNFDPGKKADSKRPLLIVPGYGMNDFIFSYHPTGLSLVEYLVEEGFEVWTVSLRAQGDSVREGGRKSSGMRELSLIDVPATVDFVVRENRSASKKLDVLGCSLGGSLVFIYAALHGTDKLGSIVAMGSPLNWVEIHPVLKFAFSSPKLAGMLKISHTRQLARYGLPLLTYIPQLLSIYLHPEIVDLSRPEMLSKTVEDPNPILNREIAEWVNNRDLVIDGQNISERLSHVTNPLLCLLSNADGIVPPATALCALDAVSSEVRDSITSGTDEIQMAHADMYISYYAQEQVFMPLANWLKSQNGVSA